MNMSQAVQKVISNTDLSLQEMQQVMELIMTGQATPAQMGGFLVGLRMKGETVQEITGAAQVMRRLATPVHVDVDYMVDTCGTGGDGVNTFNISTASAFVAASAGAHVAKHGNRSVSSSCGSADVLEAAGVSLNLNPEQVARAIEQVGVGFMFAAKHHSAVKHVMGTRKELGIRTIFNVLGPLTNPASAPNQVMGVFDKRLVRPIAEVLRDLGSEHVLVVHSEDGLDEISIAAPTYVAELKDGDIIEYTIKPEQFNISRADIKQLSVHTVEDSLSMIDAALTQENEAASDIVALNAGAAIYASGLESSLADGVLRAQDCIGSGLAKEKIAELASYSQLCES
ncbi:MAG: anthranilate phosphoribosyltransferase [Gammaproteobacteria bacterium]|nr:MAG: anthranilate phosphoribosyltransferase [Gammaproteobacteria bacterium]